MAFIPKIVILLHNKHSNRAISKMWSAFFSFSESKPKKVYFLIVMFFIALYRKLFEAEVLKMDASASKSYLNFTAKYLTEITN